MVTPATRARIDRLRPSRQHRPLRTWRLVGAAAGLLLAAASWLCAAVPHEYAPVVWPGVVPWRPEGGSSLACTVAILAMGAMVYAWWAVRDDVPDVRWVRTTAACWFGPLLLSTSLYSRDIYSYAAQGLMLHDGLDPYTEGVRTLSSPWVDSVARTWLDTPAPYGPVFLLVARACAALSGGHLLVALALLRLVAALAVVAIAVAVPAIAGRLGADERGRASATWLGVLTPIVGGHLVSGAHNDALMVAAILASVALALAHRWAAAVLAIAVATAVKAPAAVVVPFLALLWAADPRWGASPPWPRLVARALLGAVVTGVVFVVVSLLTGLGFAWVGALGTPGLSNQWTSVSTSWGTLVGWLGSLVGADVGDTAVGVARTAALLLLAVVLVGIWLDAARHAHDRRHVCRSAGFALLAVVVLSPAFHGWYLLWVLPLLAATLRGRRGLTVLGLVAALLAFAVLPGGYGLALTTTSVGVPLMVAASIAVAVAAVRRLRQVPWRRLLVVEEPVRRGDGAVGQSGRGSAGTGGQPG